MEYKIFKMFFIESKTYAKIYIERDGIFVHRRTKIINKSIDGELRISSGIKRVDGLKIWIAKTKKI